MFFKIAQSRRIKLFEKLFICSYGKRKPLSTNCKSRPCFMIDCDFQLNNVFISFIILYCTQNRNLVYNNFVL